MSSARAWVLGCVVLVGCGDTFTFRVNLDADHCARFCAHRLVLRVHSAAGGPAIAEVSGPCGTTVSADVDAGEAYTITVEVHGAMGVHLVGSMATDPGLVDGELLQPPLEFVPEFVPRLTGPADADVWVFPRGPTTLALHGEGFGATPGTVEAGPGGAALTVVSWTDTSIEVALAPGSTADSVVVSRCGVSSDPMDVRVRSVGLQSLPHVFGDNAALCQPHELLRFNPLGDGKVAPATLDGGVFASLRCVDGQRACQDTGWLGHFDRQTCTLLAADERVEGCLIDARADGPERTWISWPTAAASPTVYFQRDGSFLKTRTGDWSAVARGVEMVGLVDLWPDSDIQGVHYLTDHSPAPQFNYFGPPPLALVDDAAVGQAEASGVLTLAFPVQGGAGRCDLPCERYIAMSAGHVRGLDAWRVGGVAVVCADLQDRVLAVVVDEGLEAACDARASSAPLTLTPEVDIESAAIAYDPRRGAIWAFQGGNAVAWSSATGAIVGVWAAPPAVSGRVGSGAPTLADELWIPGPGAAVTVIGNAEFEWCPERAGSIEAWAVVAEAR